MFHSECFGLGLTEECLHFAGEIYRRVETHARLNVFLPHIDKEIVVFYLFLGDLHAYDI